MSLWLEEVYQDVSECHITKIRQEPISGGKWAPVKLIAIVALPQEARLLREEDDTSKRLK